MMPALSVAAMTTLQCTQTMLIVLQAGVSITKGSTTTMVKVMELE